MIRELNSIPRAEMERLAQSRIVNHNTHPPLKVQIKWAIHQIALFGMAAVGALVLIRWFGW